MSLQRLVRRLRVNPLPWVLMNLSSLLTEDHSRDLFPKRWGCHGCPAYQWPQQGTTNELPHQKSDRFRPLPIHSPRCRKRGPLCPRLSQQLRRAMQEGQHSLLRTRDSPQPWQSEPAKQSWKLRILKMKKAKMKVAWERNLIQMNQRRPFQWHLQLNPQEGQFTWL